MKVFNLTDISTKALRTHRLERQTLVVGKAVIAPGASDDVEDTPHMRRKLEHFLSAGAVAIDVLPPEYVSAKGKEPAHRARRPGARDERPESAVQAPAESGSGDARDEPTRLPPEAEAAVSDPDRLAQPSGGRRRRGG
jgi:hypothetical protein